MPEFFNRSRLLLQVGDLSLPVLTLEGREALSEPFWFDIETLDDGACGPAAAIGRAAVMRPAGRNGGAEVVTAVQECGRRPDDRRRLRIRLKSRLALLGHQRDQL